MVFTSNKQQENAFISGFFNGTMCASEQFKVFKSKITYENYLEKE